MRENSKTFYCEKSFSSHTSLISCSTKNVYTVLELMPVQLSNDICPDDIILVNIYKFQDAQLSGRRSGR